MLRVGLDIRGTQPGYRAHFGRGTGRYAAELAKRILGEPLSGLSVQGFTQQDLAPNAWQRFVLAALPCGKQTYESQFFLPRKFRQLPFDLLHFVAHSDAPARLTQPYLVTVLDLIPLKFPELYRPEHFSWRYRLARYLELQSIRHARGLLAISETTKQDLLELLGVAEESIVVTPLGVDAKFFSESSSESGELHAKYGLSSQRPILLYAGGIDPRKNVSFLLRLYAACLEDSSLNPKPQLLLLGKYEGDKHLPQLQREIRELALEQEVKLGGFVSDEDLLGLMQISTLFVFPSLYEGFGLPVLEAMARGVAVVAGDNSAVREVASGAACLLEDNNLRAWQLAISGLLKQDSQRQALVEQGRLRARAYSWDKTAELTLGAYARFLSAER